MYACMYVFMYVCIYVCIIVYHNIGLMHGKKFLFFKTHSPKSSYLTTKYYIKQSDYLRNMYRSYLTVT